MNDLISISGKIGHGKDEVAKIIMQLYPEQYEVKKFAYKLKLYICSLLGCTMEQIEDRVFKNTPLPIEWQESGKPVMTPRLMMQLIGTEGTRDLIHTNVWVNALFADFREKESKWIVTDTRFPNELKSIKTRGGLTVRVTRDIYTYHHDTNTHEWRDAKDDDIARITRVSGKTSNKLESYKLWMEDNYDIDEHESENAIDQSDYDVLIVNDGTLKDLVHQVKKVFKLNYIGEDKIFLNKELFQNL